ncbi:hypothetical protein cypCar_00017590 [Cyprinus carpio]|nr:hypothetical protein cypCar_00017590 [Cyprinus carpio]
MVAKGRRNDDEEIHENKPEEEDGARTMGDSTCTTRCWKAFLRILSSAAGLWRSREEFNREHHPRQTGVRVKKNQCVQRHGEVGGQQVSIIDTPGWWKHLPIEQTSELNKDEISQSASLSISGPVAYIFVLRADCSFKEQERRAMEDHLRLLGSTVWDHSIVLFIFGDLFLHLFE